MVAAAAVALGSWERTGGGLAGGDLGCSVTVAPFSLVVGDRGLGAAAAVKLWSDLLTGGGRAGGDFGSAVVLLSSDVSAFLVDVRLVGGVLLLLASVAAVLWSEEEESVVPESRFTIFFSDFMKPPPLGLMWFPESPFVAAALPCCCCCADASNKTFPWLDELRSGATPPPCLAPELPLRLVVGLPAVTNEFEGGGRSGFDGFVADLSVLSAGLTWPIFELVFEAALGGLGGGGRSGGADLVAFLFSGLSVTNGASVSSFTTSSDEGGSCCLFAGIGAAVFADELSSLPGSLSLRVGGVVGLVETAALLSLVAVVVVASLIVGGVCDVSLNFFKGSGVRLLTLAGGAGFGPLGLGAFTGGVLAF